MKFCEPPTMTRTCPRLLVSAQVQDRRPQRPPQRSQVAVRIAPCSASRTCPTLSAGSSPPCATSATTTSTHRLTKPDQCRNGRTTSVSTTTVSNRSRESSASAPLASPTRCPRPALCSMQGGPSSLCSLPRHKQTVLVWACSHPIGRWLHRERHGH